MNTPCLPLKLFAVMGLVLLLGAGCAKKDIQAASGSKSFEPGVSSADSSDGSGAMSGQSDAGFSEQDVSGQSLGEDSGYSSADASSIPGESGGESDAFGSSGESDGFESPGESDGMGSDARSSAMDTEDDTFPPFGMAGGDSSQDSLSGFGEVDPGQTPVEDRVDDGSLVAKADPSGFNDSSGMQAFQDSQLDAAAQGLADVFFEYDSWSIPEDAKRPLSEGAAWLKAHPQAQLLVEGHCDERGSLAYNLVLGEKRAKAVRSYLMELGVAPDQMNIVSYGEERPFCRGSDENCYKLNRRGHLVVQPQ